MLLAAALAIHWLFQPGGTTSSAVANATWLRQEWSFSIEFNIDRRIISAEAAVPVRMLGGHSSELFNQHRLGRVEFTNELMDAVASARVARDWRSAGNVRGSE